MPAFYLLILIAVILLWLAAGRWFRPLGDLICRLFGGAARSMQEEQTEQPPEAQTPQKAGPPMEVQTPPEAENPTQYDVLP